MKKSAIIGVLFLAALLRFFGVAGDEPPIRVKGGMTAAAGDEPPIRVKGGW